MKSFLAEYGFTYEYFKAPETLKSLIKAIRKKSKEEDLNCKWLILLDEVVIRWGQSDFSTLNLDDDDNIELVVAVNPGGINASYTIIPPQDKKFITKRFTFKHRNSLEISVFLAHLKKLTAVSSFYHPISEAEDKTDSRYIHQNSYKSKSERITLSMAGKQDSVKVLSSASLTE